MKNKHKIVNTIGLTALGSLVMLGLITIAPTVSNSASAESLTSSLSTKTTASLYSMLSLSLSDSIDIDLTPKSVGTLEVGRAEVRVSTNNTTGYSIYLSTVDGTNSLNAVNQNQHYEGEEGTDYSIKALPTSTTADAYLDNTNNLNTWAYALTNTGGATSNTTYKGLASTAGDTIYTTRSTSSNDVYDLNIAVAVDASLPAGDYRNGIVVSAVANPIEIRGFNEIYYMQEMTPDICSRATVGDEGQLVDKRDHTIYWVAKLADDNCWMTQNLDLDLSTEVALTPEDTNVEEPWTPEVSTSKEEIFSIEDSTVTNQRSQKSYDPGKYVLNDYLTGLTCVNEATKITECTNVVNVENDYQPSFIATNSIAVDVQNGAYDAHYLLGNYYQFNTAVVGAASADAPVGTRFDADICPKNWRLPETSLGTYTNDDAWVTTILSNNDFYDLVAAYGWNSGYVVNHDWSNFVYTNLNTSAQKIMESPLYIAYFGNVRAVTHTAQTPAYLSGSKNVGFWTNTRHNFNTGRNFYMDDAKIYPGAASAWAYQGENIRCIAK